MIKKLVISSTNMNRNMGTRLTASDLLAIFEIFLRTFQDVRLNSDTVPHFSHLAPFNVREQLVDEICMRPTPGQVFVLIEDVANAILDIGLCMKPTNLVIGVCHASFPMACGRVVENFDERHGVDNGFSDIYLEQLIKSSWASIIDGPQNVQPKSMPATELKHEYDCLKPVAHAPIA
jgi:hypothetical protein